MQKVNNKQYTCPTCGPGQRLQSLHDGDAERPLSARACDVRDHREHGGQHGGETPAQRLADVSHNKDQRRQAQTHHCCVHDLLDEGSNNLQGQVKLVKLNNSAIPWVKS